MSILDEHCVKESRKPGEIKRSAQAIFMLDAEPSAVEAARNARRFPVIAGDADELRQVMHEYADAGLDEIIIPTLGLGRGEARQKTMDRIMKEVAPAVR